MSHSGNGRKGAETQLSLTCNLQLYPLYSVYYLCITVEKEWNCLPSFSLFCYWWGQRLPPPPRSFWIDHSRDRAVADSVLTHAQLSSPLPTGMTLPFSHLAPAQPVKQWQRKSPFLSSQRTVPPGWHGDGEHWSGISFNRRKERERRHCGLKKGLKRATTISVI